MQSRLPIDKEMLDIETRAKVDRVVESLSCPDPIGICFSGGVDSSLVLALAHLARKGAPTIALTASAPAFPAREARAAARFCNKLGIEQVTIGFAQLEVEGLAGNPENRCYLCKTALLEKLRAAAGERGVARIVDGTNTDDLKAYRPGIRALAEQGIESPLAAAGMSKEQVRLTARALGLESWDKPSTPCIATRFEYGYSLDEREMTDVDRCEDLLLGLGLNQVRLRVHESIQGRKIARIELAEGELQVLTDSALRKTAVAAVKECGFDYVTLDLEGFRSGSMDKANMDAGKGA